MSTTTAIWEAIVQTKEAWFELLAYIVFFTALFSYVEWSTNKAIKEL